MKKYLINSSVGKAWFTLLGGGLAYAENWDARNTPRPDSLDPWFFTSQICGFIRLVKNSEGVYEPRADEWGKLMRFSKDRGTFVQIHSGFTLEGVKSAITRAVNDFLAEHLEHELAANQILNNIKIENIKSRIEDSKVALRLAQAELDGLIKTLKEATG